MNNSISSISHSGLPISRSVAIGKGAAEETSTPPQGDGVALGGGGGAEPSYQQLLERNRQLEAELARVKSEEAPIHLDPESGMLTINGLKTTDFEVEHMRVKVSALSGYLGKALSIETLLENQGQLPLPPTDQLAREPMTVDALKLRIPGSTLQKSSQLLGKEAMERNGLKDLSIKPEGQSKLRLSGTIDKLIDIPFDLSGELSVAEGNEIHFKVGKTRAFGILPVPNLVVRIAASLAGRDIEEMGVKQKGDTFIFDADDFLPKNVALQLTRLGTEGGAVVLEGKAPEEKPSTPVPHNPTTLISF